MAMANFNYESIPLNGRNAFRSESSDYSYVAKDDVVTVNPWLDRFITALIVASISCFLVYTTSDRMEVEQNSGIVRYRPYCKVPTSRYSENIRVVQTSLGEPTLKWAPQECIASTKDQATFQDAYGAPDAVFSLHLDEIAHPDRPPIIGFGGAFTEASAINFRSLSPEGQDTVLRLLGENAY